MPKAFARRRFLQLSGAALGTWTVASRWSVSGASTGTEFILPSATYRPKVRWWLPLSEIDVGELGTELDAMADAGIGGAEVYAYFAAGVDPVHAGWGTRLWAERLGAIKAAAAKRGMSVDVAVGPLAVAAMPMSSPGTDPASSKELAYGYSVIEPGATFGGPIPEPRQPPSPSAPQRELVAVVAAKAAGPISGKPVPLVAGASLDLTGNVVDGRLSWTAPDTGTWVLFGFWLRASGQSVNAGYNAHHPAPTSPNSYLIDQFSSGGTASLTGYWDEHLPGITGGDLYVDSTQPITVLPWTAELAARFHATRGYSILPHLPVLHIEGLHSFFPPTGATPDSPADFDYPGDSGRRVRNDYYQTLTELYQAEYLDPLRAWAHSRGMTLRAQPGYGQTIDMASVAAHVDIPETESLFFADRIDGYRAQAGAVHLTGAKAYSAELAPVLWSGYGQTLPDLVTAISRAYAGGVNEAVLHGFPYAVAPGAKWPGWAPFGSVFSEAWGPRQPSWRHMADVSAHLTRSQFVLRAGRPRVDLAIYRHTYWESADARYPVDPALGNAGYSYDFIGPMLLELPMATVSEGRLAEEGPGYGALVLNDERSVPPSVARRILALAKAGLPVIVVGEPPRRSPFFHDQAGADAAVQQAMAALVALPGTRTVAKPADVPAALAALGVPPAVGYSQPADLATVRRADGDTEYFHFFNHGNETVDMEVALTAAGLPYELDTWTGRITPIACYRTGGRRIHLRLRILPGQTKVLATALGERFGVRAAGARIVEGGGAEFDVVEGVVVARSAKPGKRSVVRADGRVTRVEIGTVAPVLPLSGWHLSVEDWRPGAGPAETVKVRHELDLTELRSWSEIKELEDVSGVGRYTTTFVLGEPWTGGYCAYLNLGEIVHTVRVKVNGISVGPVDPREPVLDLHGVLRRGNNTVEVEVTTTLRNRLRTLDPDLASAPRQRCGLLGPVLIEPYGEVHLPGEATA